MIFAIITAFLMGFADLYRGAKAGISRALEKAILAVLALFTLVGGQVFVVMMSDWRFAAAYLLLFAVGCSISWGSVISSALGRRSPAEFQRSIDGHDRAGRGVWYARGWFRQTAMRALLARSIVWGVLAAVPLGLFGYYVQALAMGLVYAAAMPLAVKFLLTIEGSPFDRAVGRMCQRLVDKSHSWPRHEVYRGWLAGLLLLMARACIEIANQATSGWPSHFWGA